MSALEIIRIKRLDDKGRGVGNINNKVTFVSGALPDELARIAIVEEKKRFSVARCLEVIESSPQRVRPPCPVYGQCGGCQIQHLAIDGQRNYKQEQWLSQLQRIGQINPQHRLTPLSGKPWHYRHRARLSVAYDNQSIYLGFKALKSSEIIDIEACLVLSAVLSDLLPAIKTFLSAILPHRVQAIELHEGDNAVAIGVHIIDRDLHKDVADDFITQKFYTHVNKDNLPKPIQLWLKNQQSAYRPLSPPEASLYYELPVAELSIAYTPNDFTQINHAMNREMVKSALALLAPEAGESVADLFCGLGNFSLPLAKAGVKVVSVEGVQAMVNRLQKQAASLALAERITPIKQDLFNITPAQINGWGKLDKWLLDPPRAGAKELITAIPKNARPNKIVYVSCNPATLARDAHLLIEKGYQFTAGHMIDLFPQTAHIESINVFER